MHITFTPYPSPAYLLSSTIVSVFPLNHPLPSGSWKAQFYKPVLRFVFLVHLLFHYSVSLYPTYESDHLCLALSFWLISLGVILSSSIHNIVTNCMILFQKNVVPHLAVLKHYCWLCTQELLLVGSENHKEGMLEIEPRLTVYREMPYMICFL